ncbi:MAG: hypothetical protein RLZZ385_2831 [Pseudomonadota bacterium]|jgi:TonB-dependent receptor
MQPNNFRLKGLTLAVSFALTGLSTATVNAQPQAAEPASFIESIVVTGVRGSLARALDQKRASNGILDGISSEDIMDYPDLNIADSLQRITGVTVERTLGEAQNIAVRGLASEFTRVSINGQNVVSGNNGREVDFDVFASELFTNVQVRKSHSAELVEGGLAGTVDLRTARPFDYAGEDTLLALSARATSNDLAEETDPRISGVASGVFADGKVGMLGSISYSEQNLRQDNVEGLRFIQADLDANRDTVLDTFKVEYPFIPRYVNENIGKDRLGLTGALQFRPTNTFDIALDVAYATIEEVRKRYSIDGLIQAADVRTPLSPPVIDGSGLIVEASLPNVDNRSENIYTPLEDELLLVNSDLSWDLADNLVLRGKLGYSDASRTTEEFRSTWTDTGSFRYSFADRTFVKIEGVGRNIFDPALYNRHEARFINTETTDSEYSAQTDLEWLPESSFSAVKVGLRYEDREKDTLQFDGRQTATADFEDYSLNLPADNFFESNDSPNIVRNWPIADFDAVLNSAALVAPNLVIPQRLVATNTIGEETVSGYLQGDLDTVAFGGRSLVGSIGLRAVSTEQSATGYPTNNSRITVASDYTEVLPSANFTFEATDDLLVRVGAARSLTRPTITDLTPGGTVAVSVPTASFGNPALSPYTAWNYDLSMEWYFADEALLSVALFDKDVDGFVTRVSAPEILGSDVLGAGDPRAGTEFSVSRPVNGESAFVRGFELAFQAPLSTFVGEDSPLSGFGFLANYTRADSESEILFNGQTIKTLLRGQSESSYNFISYYESGSFSARLAYAWRDAYLDEIRPASAERSNFIDAYGQLDANIQYNLTDNIVLTLDALNLLGEEQYRYAERTDRNIRYSETGRFMLIGVRAKF